MKAILNKDRAFYPGFIKAIVLLSQIIKSRTANKKLFVRKDKEITKNFTK